MVGSPKVQIVECPRDAMQGIKTFIPTHIKINYINKLLRVGFDTLDMGSFVSPKAIPQMADTAAVIRGIDLSDTTTELLTIVANTRGARDAIQHDAVTYLGYPFSISETFQMRNTNATIDESLIRVADIQSLAIKNRKKLQIYISMGFGNPYGDEWSVEIVEKWVNELYALGIRLINLSDTIGVSTPESISYLYSNLIPIFPDVTFSAHLHTTPDRWEEKVKAAYDSGCRRFDGAFKGFGGCPMAKDELTGNIPTEKMVEYFRSRNIDMGLDLGLFRRALEATSTVY